MDGLTITQGTARAIAAFPEMEGELVQIGRRVALDPCVPEHMLAAIRQREGRACPRVELEPKNEESAVLLSLLLREETRVLAPTWIEQNLTHLGDEESQRVVNRTISALNAESVQAALKPLTSEAKAEQ